MFRSAAVCLLLIVAIQAVPLPFGGSIDKIPADIKALIPKEVVEFYKGLTPEDKQIIKELGAKAKEFKSEQEAIEALKAKSESLYNRAKVIYDLVKSKVDALQPEANTFIKTTIAAVRALRPADGKSYDIPKVKETAKTIIGNYQALSAEAKADLQGQFPQITALIKNEKIKKIAKSLLEKN
ncbi:hypothetical protein QR680_013779 [Steinernema hermaphroditum]|uniref:Fatty-acid and retinol-binding protein 1 n=1 Tax=Steinernema hermaphroditum TaxID=289476 RepID=A0AA39I8Q7_9BILA|nr:hypothetical protein QR680_013779 [Steinernema hermaphroditum]